MTRLALLFSVIAAAAAIGLAQPSGAAAGWCWPSCSGYGMLGPGTSTANGCWYYSEVCSGWGYWYLNGVSKTCYPGCDRYNGTNGKILYGYENRDRIRGNFTTYYGKRYVQPGELGMGGYLRAQVTWWAGTTSQINVAVAG
ncbi:hypothetical protein AYO48_01045 [Gaiella sp. SCGC AG-212-M14]|nr:hypothetical protein AYO48_01045 [Gaiella sp. SCGC AG-212-M14]